MISWQLSGSDGAPNARVQDAVLRQPGVELYPARGGAIRARALIVFFGDSGCWRPYRRLASALANDGYAVIAVHARLAQPVVDSVSARSTEDALAALISHVIAEISPALESTPGAAAQPLPMPVVLMGHAEGASLALWASQHVAINALRGIVTLSAQSAGSHPADTQRTVHFTLTSADQAARARDASQVVLSTVRVASITGSLGPAGLVSRVQRRSPTEAAFAVPFSTVRLTSPLLTGIAVRRSLNWILAPQ